MDTITTAAKNNPIYTAAAADNRCRYFFLITLSKQT